MHPYRMHSVACIVLHAKPTRVVPQAMLRTMSSAGSPFENLLLIHPGLCVSGWRSQTSTCSHLPECAQHPSLM